MTDFPYYKKTVVLGAVLPLISYATFTPAERIYLGEVTASTQKVVDETTIKLVDSIAQKLDCDQLDAMAVLMAVEQEQELDKRQVAAYELAKMENRPAARAVVYEQFTFIINSRLDREKFDAKLFEEKYKVKSTGEWTIDCTMAVVDLHPAIEAFIAGESTNKQISDEDLTPGESSPASVKG